MNYLIIKELKAKDKIIAELKDTLKQLKSQLLDVYKEDSLIITIINNSLKQKEIKKFN